MPTRARLRRLQRKFCSRVSRAEPHSSMNLFLFASIPPPIFSSFSSSSSLSGVCFFLCALSLTFTLRCVLVQFYFQPFVSTVWLWICLSLVWFSFSFLSFFFFFLTFFIFFFITFFIFFLTLYLKGLCLFISKMIMVCNIYCIIKCYIILGHEFCNLISISLCFQLGHLKFKFFVIQIVLRSISTCHL